LYKYCKNIENISNKLKWYLGFCFLDVGTGLYPFKTLEQMAYVPIVGTLLGRGEASQCDIFPLSQYRNLRFRAFPHDDLPVFRSVKT
jgi:hypothetical protein